MPSKIIAHAWIAGSSSIGVIITHDPINENEPYKARIGTVSGQSEEVDLNYLRDWGDKLPIRCALSIIDDMGIWYEPGENVDIYRYAVREAKTKSIFRGHPTIGK